MEDTHFVNCTGLDDEPSAAEHLTSAYDIALMSGSCCCTIRILRSSPLFGWIRCETAPLAWPIPISWSGFTRAPPGSKPAIPPPLGTACLPVPSGMGWSWWRVVLHCASSPDRFQSAKALLDYGFANYALVPVQEGEPLSPVPVVLGEAGTVQPVPSGEEQLLIDKSLRQSVTRTVELEPSVQAPVSQGAAPGHVDSSGRRPDFGGDSSGGSGRGCPPHVEGFICRRATKDLHGGASGIERSLQSRRLPQNEAV